MKQVLHDKAGSTSPFNEVSKLTVYVARNEKSRRDACSATYGLFLICGFHACEGLPNGFRSIKKSKSALFEQRPESIFF